MVNLKVNNTNKKIFETDTYISCRNIYMSLFRISEKKIILLYMYTGESKLLLQKRPWGYSPS